MYLIVYESKQIHLHWAINKYPFACVDCMCIAFEPD